MALPKVGFGKHSQLSYSALEKQQPAYCDWVLAQSFPFGSPQARLQAHLLDDLRGAPRGASPPRLPRSAPSRSASSRSSPSRSPSRRSSSPVPRSSSPRRPNLPLIANVVGSSAQTAKKWTGFGSWKEYWVESTDQPWPRLCAYSGCRNPPDVGGHVYAKGKTSGYFIVPICTSCNLSGKRDWRRGETAWTRSRSTLAGPVPEISETKTLRTDGGKIWDARRTKKDGKFCAAIQGESIAALKASHDAEIQAKLDAIAALEKDISAKAGSIEQLEGKLLEIDRDFETSLQEKVVAFDGEKRKAELLELQVAKEQARAADAEAKVARLEETMAKTDEEKGAEALRLAEDVAATKKVSVKYAGENRRLRGAEEELQGGVGRLFKRGVKNGWRRVRRFAGRE